MCCQNVGFSAEALLCLNVFPLYLNHWELPQWMYIEFSQLLFVHLSNQSYGFYPLFCSYGPSHVLICMYWVTVLTSQEQIALDHGPWCCCCAVGVHLLALHWGSFLLCSPGTSACSFPSYSALGRVVLASWNGLKRISYSWNFWKNLRSACCHQFKWHILQVLGRWHPVDSPDSLALHLEIRVQEGISSRHVSSGLHIRSVACVHLLPHTSSTHDNNNKLM